MTGFFRSIDWAIFVVRPMLTLAVRTAWWLFRVAISYFVGFGAFGISDLSRAITGCVAPRLASSARRDRVYILSGNYSLARIVGSSLFSFIYVQMLSVTIRNKGAFIGLFGVLLKVVANGLDFLFFLQYSEDECMGFTASIISKVREF